MRILIIEDDRESADYLVKAFREVGYIADLGHRETFLAVGGEIRHIADLAECLDEIVGGLAVIFDDQDAHLGNSSGSGGGHGRLSFNMTRPAFSCKATGRHSVDRKSGR